MDCHWVYALFMLGIGVWYSRKGTDMAGFTVGRGRNAGAWISALSYGTAYFSAVMFIGYSGGSGWSYGLWSVLVGVGNAVFGTLLAWLVLANRTRDITRRHDIKSMPQLFEKRFQSRGMRLFACAVIFVFLIPYSASVYKGLTSVCSVILGIDETVVHAHHRHCLGGGAGAGGLHGHLKGGLCPGLHHDGGRGGPDCAGGAVPPGGRASPRALQYDGLHGEPPDGAPVRFLCLGPGFHGADDQLWHWGLPQMVHKYYGIRDKREVSRGVIISTFFSLLVAGGGYFIGSFSTCSLGRTCRRAARTTSSP